MNMIKENGFINKNYILTAIEADCYGKTETFFILAKKYGEYMVLIEFLLEIEGDRFESNKCEICDHRYDFLSFDIESVTKYAKEHLEKNALEMYASLKRKLQAEKPSVSFSYCHEYADIEDDYGRSIADYTYDSDTMCISLPCSILGEEVCDIINTFDGDCEIAVDRKEKAVKIYHSIVESNDRLKQRYSKTGIKMGKTNVRSFLNLDDPNENSNDDSYEEQEQQDENLEENANQILAMFKTVEDKNEENAASSEEDTVLV